MATKTVLETLEAARKLIESRKNWTKGEYARDAKSRKVRWDSEEARKFCAVGAMSKAIGGFAVNHAAWDAIQESMEGMPHIFNDNHTHKQILAAFDAAIAKEKIAAAQCNACGWPLKDGSCSCSFCPLLEEDVHE